MNVIQPYIDSLLSIWHQSSPAARVGILLLAVLCAVTIGGVGYWSVQPNFVTLVSQEDSDKMDRVIDALDKAGIAYQLSGAGGNLLVDKRDFAKARLLARSNGVAGTSEETGTMFGSALSSPKERAIQARVQKQRSLAATIEKIAIVEHADVHLNVPDKGPFERETSAPSASVLLTLRDGSQLTDQQASSIASFVAYAVEDLSPEGVQITDLDGRSYTIPDEETGQIASQVEYIAQAERKLAQKAEAQLLKFLGYGNASVQVSLDMTFTQGSKKITSYDREGAVPSQEDLISETTKNVQPAPVGAAGVASNLNATAGTNTKSGMESTTENIKTTYLVPITEETSANSTPIRNLLSVSVLVNSEADTIKLEDGSLMPNLAEMVNETVKNAVGFRDETDTISVNVVPFSEPLLTPAEPVSSFDWTKITSIVEKASLAIAALLAFVLGLMLLRKFGPSSNPRGMRGEGQIGAGSSESVGELSRLIKENPEVFAQVVKAWSGADGAKDSGKQNAA
ncbi:flagellar basal-body MS-ring/collar protein FliF [Roseiconus lacunae]|uniref:flagellar basal-body MS-ring/collar protein FliF n=1 Tax=Roseiconus lacunae TaxID=2605694 RepID=UPI0011F38341|nr:flagellar basal-body MS-ring/collar protein FliF [Roseiconus lacunae]MCD0459818.1 flagellar M-ring protein FliF [Roseiconus lacunae]WRQ49829.1 flagellar basal-body MS-ring/collar protein FliF [Stieleria sp. HD01]